MPHIDRILAVPAVGGYYIEDLAALQANPMAVSERYTAEPVSEGFRRVRQVAEAVSVGLVLDSGQVAWGDCVAVAYSGKAGRDPVFRTEAGLESIREHVVPAFEGRPVTTFRELADELERLVETTEVTRPVAPPEPELDEEGQSRRAFLTMPTRILRDAIGRPERRGPVATERVVVQRQLHTAVRYGVSQALLRAVALTRGMTPCEVICEEWDLPLPEQPVPIHAQSGGARRRNADKMIVRRIASLPHALVDDIPRQLGENGVELVRYVRWLRGRIRELDGADYRPTIHLDVHGALGQVSEQNLGRVLGHLVSLETAARPYRLRVESPVIMESRAAQIEAMGTLREYVQFRDMTVQLVADEWANTLEDIQAFADAEAADMIQVKMPDLGSVHNTVEAVLACQAGGVSALLGGSCAETDLSARVSVHIALATRPEFVMAKPGMGVDEGIMIVHNEMRRVLARIQSDRSASGIPAQS
ncbi:MAG: methylaspartate ammonia-lyase [Anaerolineae bacterium]|jgi:methylaspartate ammonia-lyase